MLNIIFVSTTCSDAEYSYIQSIKHSEKLNPSQKFFSMLINGLISDKSCTVHCVTARAIAHSNSYTKYLASKYEKISENLDYCYLTIVNRRFIRNICNVFSAFLEVKKHLNYVKSNQDTIVICDPLAFDVSIGAMLACRGKKIVKNAIITDLPHFMTQIDKSGSLGIVKKVISVLREKIINRMLYDFDSFCFLTESMNEINKYNKPYIVIEGMIPNEKKYIIDNHVDSNVFLYAGGLFPQFGTNLLVDAAKKIKNSQFEMHFYGEGSSIEYIQEASEKDPRIKYMGIATLDEIVQYEKKAKCLINPRPTFEKFTEYSFPSKTLEYLSAARPVLSTKLKGIPSEYYDFVIPIEEETIDGISKAIDKVLNMEEEELDIRGMNGYIFALENKNCNFQAKRFIEFLKDKCIKK